MKTRIGTTEFEFVSPAELRSILGEAAAMQRRLSPQTTRPFDAILLDGTGGGTLELYKVPAGLEFALHRLLITDDTHTPGAPFTAAAGYADIRRRGGARDDFVLFSAAAGGIPAKVTYSDVTAPRYRNLETIEIVIVGGPANTSITVKAQGTLSPLTIE